MATSKNVFGETVIYQRPPAAAVTIKAIFTDSYKEVDPNKTIAELASTHALVDIRMSDLASPPVRGDLITVGAAEYAIFLVEPDGWARYRCHLEDL